MLDIKLFRENPEIILESEKKRFRGDSEIIILLRKLLNMIHYGEKENAN